MIQEFAIHVFYPDGDAPESGIQTPDRLSDKWLTICSAMLDEAGPVMNRNMGSTLAHFDVKMVGLVGSLSAYGHECFHFGISRGTNSEQDQATTQHFQRLVEKTVQTLGNTLTEDANAVLVNSAATPSFLLFDTLHPEVADDQKSALAQLGIHLAAAYFRYSKAPTKTG